MNLFKKILFIYCFLQINLQGFSQNSNIISNSNMLANGKINVVIAVLLTILTGILLYLIYIDNKINQLKK